MKNQALFSSKDKSKKLKCPLLQFLFGALRVKSRHSSTCVPVLICHRALLSKFSSVIEPCYQSSYLP